MRLLLDFLFMQVARVALVTLTLARFILESSLMESELVTARDSKLAAAALFIAQKMQCEGNWVSDWQC